MNAEEMNRPPHIVSIEKIWRQENGSEVYHLIFLYFSFMHECYISIENLFHN